MYITYFMRFLYVSETTLLFLDMTLTKLIESVLSHYYFPLFLI